MLPLRGVRSDDGRYRREGWARGIDRAGLESTRAGVEVTLQDVPDEAERDRLRGRLMDLVGVHRALAEQAAEGVFHRQGSLDRGHSATLASMSGSGIQPGRVW